MKRVKEKIFFGVIILVILLSAFYLIQSANKGKLVDGYPKYYLHRPAPDYEMNLNYTNNSVEVYSLNYKSLGFMNDKSATIYGLLFIPKNISEKVPGLIMLPGGGVAKEGFSIRAMQLANLGYAVLILDQRGIGQTGGAFPSMQQDYEIFSSGKESILHLSVYDALVAFDVLKDIKEVDKNSIALIGESMGGRYSIIATALEDKLNGAIAISSSGYHFKDEKQPYTAYLLSIDPDNYITKISPRPIFMFQGDNDTIVELKDAEYTFNLAKEPKDFFIAEGCIHGYCKKMEDKFLEEVSKLFE